MPDARLDVEAFVAALDAQRKAKNISWRELARQSGVSPSTLVRMQQGKLPDVNTYTSLLEWSGLDSKDFTLRNDNAKSSQNVAHPLAVASTLLRGKKQMSPKATKALVELVHAAYKLTKELQ